MRIQIIREERKGDMAGSRMKLGELGTFIRDQRRSARLSLRKLSDLAGISNPYLSQIERGLRKPSAEILQAIAKALSISSETLYVQAGILEENRDQDLVAEILKDTALTNKQKQNLIDTYRNYVELNAVGATRDAVERAEATNRPKSVRKPAAKSTKKTARRKTTMKKTTTKKT
jgi:transcriptional regulator with XRE-family HTH domain